MENMIEHSDFCRQEITDNNAEDIRWFELRSELSMHATAPKDLESAMAAAYDTEALLMRIKDEQYALTRKSRTIVRLSAPFSALMAFCETYDIYRRLLKEPEKVEKSLYTVKGAIEKCAMICSKQGMKLCSIADPCAMPEIMGLRLYRRFAALPAIRMLGSLQRELLPGVLHICPRMCSALENVGLIESAHLDFGYGSYMDKLLEYAYTCNDVAIIAKRCIHDTSEGKQQGWTLHLKHEQYI